MDKQKIDVKKVLSALWSERKLFYKSLPTAFILSSLIIVSVPRYYTCEVKLAPEIDMPNSSNSISSLASSFLGTSVNLTSDAIQPALYPDLMESKDFIVSLFPITVVNSDGDLRTNYYDYIKNHQKKAWWSYPIDYLFSLFEEKTNEKQFTGTERIKSFYLTKMQNNVAQVITKKISCSTDKKTDVISIVVTDQDKLICATLADSIRVKLQAFITNYRTNKARHDFDYYKQLTNEAKIDYERARQLYASFSDANSDIILASYKAKMEDLENDMQLKYNAYSTLTTQLQYARTKVQERTPAFTILQGASVPVKPAGPKRMIFVAFVLFMTFTATGFYAINKILKDGEK